MYKRGPRIAGLLHYCVQTLRIRTPRGNALGSTRTQPGQDECSFLLNYVILQKMYVEGPQYEMYAVFDGDVFRGR